MDSAPASKRGRSDSLLNHNSDIKKPKQEMETISTSIGGKSKPCTKFFSTTGCPFGEGCHFLHYVPGGFKVVGAAALPSFSDIPSVIAPGVKTKLCKNYNTAEGCRFGEKCIFAHGEWEIGKPNVPPPAFPAGPNHHGGRFAGGRPDALPPVPAPAAAAAASFGASATAKISVDGSLTGAIIGKGGVNSKQISHMTGARLSIRDHDTDPNLKNIELEGSFDQIKQASAMVRELILNVGPAAPAPFPASAASAPFAAPVRASPQGGANFKTKMCDNFVSGSCMFGDRCRFAHGEEERRGVS